jgi:phenylacetate-CoA ligase
MLQAASSSKFWAYRFNQYGVDIQSEDGFNELSKLPILHKSDIQSISGDLMPNKSILRQLTRYPLLPARTSGTTGAGLKFFSTREAEQERWATWWRYRQTNGISPSSWCLTFAGRAVISPEQRNPPFWRYNLAGKQILFSAYHLSDQTAPHYLQKILDSQVAWVHGYPSFLAQIASYSLRFGFDVSDSVRFVTTGAEQLHDHQRLLIEQAFGLKVIDHYGQSEGVANFSQLSRSHQYSVDEDYSIVEFLPSRSVSGLRIVGTNLLNHAFPLFRYEVGDLASDIIAASSREPFRRVSAVHGRSEDYLVLSDGSSVGRLDHLLKGLGDVLEAQFIQVVRGEADLLYVARSPDDTSLRSLIMSRAKLFLGTRISLRLIRVSSVPRTSTGKIKFVVSSVSPLTLPDS